MPQTNIDSSDKINTFLLLKKEAGLRQEKIQIYLNLLKFFTDYLAKMNLSAESIDNPVDVVMKVKFESLQAGAQQEYLQLFLDYLGFCKSGALPEETNPAMSKSYPLDGKVAKAKAEAQGGVRCPKCGSVQKASAVCSKCGYRMQTTRKSTDSVSGKDSPKVNWLNPKFLLLLSASVVIAAAFYYFSRDKEDQSRGVQARAIKTIANKDELKVYAGSVKEYLDDLGSIVKSYNDLKKVQGRWDENEEMVLVNLNLLLSRLEKIEPIAEFRDTQNRIMSLHSRMLKEVDTIKSNINSVKGLSGDVGRSPRLFNSANVLSLDIERERKNFLDILRDTCKFNNVNCPIK